VLVGRGVDLGRPRVQRTRDHGVRVIDDQQHPGGRAADRLRAEVRVRGRLVGDPERPSPDRQLRDDLGVADLIVHDRAERGRVELDRLRSAPDGQLREDLCHSRGPYLRTQ
jgi:hypothetical protein